MSNDLTRKSIIVVKHTGGSEICAVALGGSANKRDKIFFSSGQKLTGVNRKGQEFFSMQSNRSEKTSRMVVKGNWTLLSKPYRYYLEPQYKPSPT
jgi:hypothetical protein